MKKVSARNILGHIAILSTLTVVFGYACGPTMNVSSDNVSFSSTTDTSGGGEDKYGNVIDSGKATAAVPILQQQFNSLHAALQLTTPTQAARNEYNLQVASLSDTGLSDTVSASLTMSTVKLNAQVCTDKVTAEAAMAANQRTLFNAINFAQVPGTTLTQANLDQTINRLARSLWQRNETPEEKTTLSTNILANLNYDNTAAIAAADTRFAMVALCTIMSSSLSSLSM